MSCVDGCSFQLLLDPASTVLQGSESHGTHEHILMYIFETPNLEGQLSVFTSPKSSSCGLQSADQFVWVSGLPLRPLTRFYLALLSSSDNYFILLSKALSLTRKQVCSLQCSHSLVRLLTTNNHTLPSHLRLCSRFVSSYDSQGLRWRYSNPPPHGEEGDLTTISYIGIHFVPHRKFISSPLQIQPGH
jgi:hypothetical protein